MKFFLLLSRFRDGEFAMMDFEFFKNIMWPDATIEKDEPGEGIYYEDGHAKFSYSDIDGNFSGAPVDAGALCGIDTTERSSSLSPSRPGQPCPQRPLIVLISSP